MAHYIIDRIQREGFIDKQYYYYRKTPTGMCQTSVVKPWMRYDYILACEDRLKYAMRKDMCVPQVRANVIKAVLSYLTTFYGADAAKNADYEAAVNLLREQRRLPYDGGLLNGKYKVYLACFDRVDMIHKVGRKCLFGAKVFEDSL